MTRKFILDGHDPVPCEDVHVWANWFEKADRQVAYTELPDNIRVSTIFTGLNYNFSESGNPPMLFETAIFGGENVALKRYATWDEAVAEHKKMVDMLRKTE